MQSELLPCPFCGTTQGLRVIGAAKVKGEGWAFVRCDMCDAEGPDPDSKVFWNDRAATSPAGDLVARLEREADNMQFNEDLDSMDDGIALLREAAQALRHQSTGVTEGWQDISTAPRDKTKVLVARIGEGPIIARQTPMGVWLNCFPTREEDRVLDGDKRPTHWMSLPTPPAALSAQERG